jgi:hypothetical protein
MVTKIRFAAALLSAFFLGVTAAQAADPAVNCESGKLKEAGKYGNCRLKADSKAVKKGEAKAVKKGEAADYTKCETKFADKWAKTETKAGVGICPSEGDQASIDARITTDAAEIATLLAGGAVSVCGNSVVEAGEDCDFGDLNGETCATQGLFGDGLACGVGCVFDTSGCSATRYEDTGLGSVIDHQTGLEWQKTDDAGGLTDKDNYYTWTGDGPGGTAANGTAFGTFLEGLNGGTASSGAGPTTAGYAGHNDWRMPRIEELTTIVDCSFGNPCIDQSVFGATNASARYWSASTVNGNPDFARFVFFNGGSTNGSNKNNSTLIFQVRAVRGGS